MEHYKWPRTWHLPFSPGLQNDDRRIPSLSPFEGRRIIVSEKYDGEGTTMERGRTFPRSPDGRYHPSRDRMKAFHASRAADIPNGWKISGEYMYARHSVAYEVARGNALPDWFMGFGVWNEQGVLIGWDETLEVFALLNIPPVAVLYDGPYHEDILHGIARQIDPSIQEGFVVRVADPILYPSGPGDVGRFFPAVAKWVRKGHVQSDQHWMHRWRDAPGFVNEISV